MSLFSVMIWLPVVVISCLAAGWLFQQALIRSVNETTAKFLRTAPLTACFGMLTIILYIILLYSLRSLRPTNNMKFLRVPLSLGHIHTSWAQIILVETFCRGWFMVRATRLA